MGTNGNSVPKGCWEPCQGLCPDHTGRLLDGRGWNQTWAVTSKFAVLTWSGHEPWELIQITNSQSNLCPLMRVIALIGLGRLDNFTPPNRVLPSLNLLGSTELGNYSLFADQCARNIARSTSRVACGTVEHHVVALSRGRCCLGTPTVNQASS